MHPEAILVLTSAPICLEKIISWPPHAEQNRGAEIRVNVTSMKLRDFIHQLPALRDLTMLSGQFCSWHI